MTNHKCATFIGVLISAVAIIQIVTGSVQIQNQNIPCKAYQYDQQGNLIPDLNYCNDIAATTQVTYIVESMYYIVAGVLTILFQLFSAFSKQRRLNILFLGNAVVLSLQFGVAVYSAISATVEQYAYINFYGFSYSLQQYVIDMTPNSSYYTALCLILTTSVITFVISCPVLIVGLAMRWNQWKNQYTLQDEESPINQNNQGVTSKFHNHTRIQVAGWLVVACAFYQILIMYGNLIQYYQTPPFITSINAYPGSISMGVFYLFSSLIIWVSCAILMSKLTAFIHGVGGMNWNQLWYVSLFSVMMLFASGIMAAVLFADYHLVPDSFMIFEQDFLLPWLYFGQTLFVFIMAWPSAIYLLMVTSYCKAKSMVPTQQLTVNGGVKQKGCEMKSVVTKFPKQKLINDQL